MHAEFSYTVREGNVLNNAMRFNCAPAKNDLNVNYCIVSLPVYRNPLSLER